MSSKVPVAYGLRKFFIFSAILTLMVIGLFLYENNLLSRQFWPHWSAPHLRNLYEHGLYVNSSRCKMPRTPAFTEKIRLIYSPPPKEDCRGSGHVEPAFVTSTYDEHQQVYRLLYDATLLQQRENSSESTVKCCYQQIYRANSADSLDSSRTGSCLEFEQDFVVPQSVKYGVIVKCFLIAVGEEKPPSELRPIYEDAFMFVHKKTRRVFGAAETQRKPSVLLIGIDSLSRMNFQRVMPETHNFLLTSQWYEMEGYNKIEDNTFPNLMAILTGLNTSSVDLQCEPNGELGLDACNFLWNDFGAAGYFTAYGEDLSQLSTFNYKKKGFNAKPVDHYLRPFMLAVEKELPKRYRDSLPYCVGHRQTASYVLDFAGDFARRYCHKDSAAFGLFWSNSFSHNSFEQASSMDEKVRDYLQVLSADGVLDEAVVIFFSDHGSRWGPLMQLPESYLEERLPMLFVWLPPWFRELYPEEARALGENRNRLTSPFDLHATLRHLLALGNGGSDVDVSQFVPSDCPQCQSLLRPLPIERSCSKAGIPEHWCTCFVYDWLDLNDPMMWRLGLQIVAKMNGYLGKKDLSDICEPIVLKRLILAERRHNPGSNGKFKVYRLKFETMPKEALFQATVLYWPELSHIEVDVESISRLNMYLQDSRCLEDRILKKYCFCRE